MTLDEFLKHKDYIDQLDDLEYARYLDDKVKMKQT